MQNIRLRSKLTIGLLAAIAIDTVLQLAWKTTVLETAADASPWATLGSVFANPTFIGVIALMAMQFLNWLIVLSQADLSYVKPMSSLSYASVPVVSALALDETVDRLEVVGIACVLVGVWLISQTQPLTKKSPQLRESEQLSAYRPSFPLALARWNAIKIRKLLDIGKEVEMGLRYSIMRVLGLRWGKAQQ